VPTVEGIATTMTRHAFLDHPGPIPFAHRGGAGPWPENSWPAFENAVALGYRYLETDVRVTRDGTVMVMHDPTLERVADRPGRLGDLTTAEASRVRLRPPADSTSSDGEPIPLLTDLLDRWPETRLNLDVKEPAALEPTLAALRRANAFGRVCVTSFDDAVAREARRLAGPALCLGAGMSAIALARLRSLLPRGARGAEGSADASRRRPWALPGRDVVQVPVAFRSFSVCDARFVRYANALGLPVHVWTVNDEATMGALLDVGAEGIITDRPALLRDVLVGRGLWRAGS
jgi:glycerophosphoryl diester phosphodiesterase